MDDFSRELFDNIEVIFVDYTENEQDIQDACRILFGRTLTEEDFVMLLGLPDGASVKITARCDDETVDLEIDYHWFDEIAEYSVSLVDDKRVTTIDNFHVQDEAQDGLGTRLIAKLIAGCQLFGIDRIELFAAGYPDDPGILAGYYFWPRLGFVMYNNLPSSDLMDAGLEPVDNTLDLFRQDGGDAWWREHGSAGDAYFYCQEGSQCITALQAYLQAKGVEIDGGTDNDRAATSEEDTD